LVATVENENESSDVESCADSESETEVYSKLTRSELIDSIKELLGHYEYQSSELRKALGLEFFGFEVILALELEASCSD